MASFSFRPTTVICPNVENDAEINNKQIRKVFILFGFNWFIWIVKEKITIKDGFCSQANLSSTLNTQNSTLFFVPLHPETVS
jgi:hypothetical protein